MIQEWDVTPEQKKRIDELLQKDEQEKLWEESRDKALLSFRDVISCIDDKFMVGEVVINTTKTYPIDRKRFLELFKKKVTK